MNVFVIPSWYPSSSFPSVGIFFKEQTLALAQCFPNWKFGISLWGSHEPELWLKASRPLSALLTYGFKPSLGRKELLLEANCVEFFHPAHTWTRRIMSGNIAGIIEANRLNMERYIQCFGVPDVIHAHVAYPAGYIAKSLSDAYQIPYVVTEHTCPFPLPSFRWDFKRRVLPPLLQADKVLAVGQNLVNTLSQYDVHAELIPNFIDVSSFPLKESGSDVPVIFVLGRLVRQKGVHLLLQALSGIRELRWQLKIGGSGAEEGKLRRLVSALKIQEHVVFLGELSQEEVKFEMSGCDFLVFPSLPEESFGVVLLEAMACGKPIVYTTCGGITLGLPVEVGIRTVPKVEAIEIALREMLVRYREYDAQSIRQFVEQNYSASIISQRLAIQYQGVLDKSIF